jgi:hypothetical protein
MNRRWSERDERPLDGLSLLNLRSNSDCTPRVGSTSDVRNGSILLKNSKIERLRKSRERQLLVVSAAASLFSMGCGGSVIALAGIHVVPRVAALRTPH